MQIQSAKVKNFRTLKSIEMTNIPGFAVLVGPNGSGKSTFIDVFEFLKDCLTGDVRSALQKRGGFSQVVSRGTDCESIFIELKVKLDFKDEEVSRLVTYQVEIAEEDRIVSVKREILRFRRALHTGQPYHFLDFRDGKGTAVKETNDAFNRDVDYRTIPREEYELEKPYFLAIKALGQLADFDAASQLRSLIEQWTVSDFHIADARGEPDAAPAEHLSASGDNLALYTQYLHDDYPEVFQSVIKHMADRVPGVAEVNAQDTGDGRVVLRFRDEAFEKPFIARSVSDGTIKMFAYLALLADPNPHPLLCVEEPENQLYPTLLAILAEEFADYARRRHGDGQVFVTTHSPDFLNEVPLDSIFWLKKVDGYSTIHRASDDAQLRDFIKAGDKPGWLWRQNLLAGVNP